MVSFQAQPLSPNQKKSSTDSENSCKKRKWDNPFPFVEQLLEKRSKPADQIRPKSFDVELQLETPLPMEWQRCLDIQSGQIHFYNTRTQMKTSRDPRGSTPEPPITNHMSLDLELNLRCDSQPHPEISPNSFRALFKNNSSRLGLELDHDQEMVATVCMRCHMLVMLCKSSPACPNCKYMHTPDQSPPTLFKPMSQGHAASSCASKIKAWY
ncbi:protein CURLY FLAG LEAF 1-like [Argentina anserina]|uniref:protein CURLY FLAG LEAF 1-like n=1 Tax=Argentina anserina TaxID=57926 RepID=UPI0021764452|nr:protein CURLY FLAG LEAF 1-like [Potentilla anserina]